MTNTLDIPAIKEAGFEVVRPRRDTMPCGSSSVVAPSSR